jgi:hypothetical protein
LIANNEGSEYTKGDPVTKAIQNNLNMNYWGDIYFGSDASMKATVLFDTGSMWLTVMSTLCNETCEPQNRVYNPANSSESKLAAPEEFDSAYGIGAYKGYNYTDVVCLLPNSGSDQDRPCANNFNFMAIS